MLFLTRRVGEEIVLPGCGVTLQVLKVGKNQIRLGLTAPGNVPIRRTKYTLPVAGRTLQGAEGEQAAADQNIQSKMLSPAAS